MEIKKIIAVDMDGTALPDDNGFTPFSRDYFSSLNKLGYMMVLCSGRPYRALERYYRQIGCYGPLVCYNGGHVFHPDDPSFPDLRYNFPYQEIKAIYDEAKPFLTSFMYESQSAVHSLREDLFLNHYFPKDGMVATFGEPHRLKGDIYTCLFECEHSYDTLLKSIIAKHSTILHRHWSDCLYSELYHPLANKGNAIAHIMKVYGVKKEDVIAFGDSLNDAEMLRVAGTSFAMKGGKSKQLLAEFPNTEKGAAESGVAFELMKILG